MQFQHYDLGILSGGETVVVGLEGNAANVLLLDSNNFSTYRQKGTGYKYYGGHVQQSPFRIRVPHSGHWHVAIDLGGYGGTVKSTVRVV